MVTEDAILNFIPTRVSGTGFSASQFTLPSLDAGIFLGIVFFISSNQK